MLRNFISVTGITQEKDLPKRVKGQLLQHSHIDYIFIPSNRPRVKELTHIGVSVDIKNHRIIKGPKGSVIILDGFKKLKVCYIPENRSKRTIQVELYLPYNTHIEIDGDVKAISNIDIYIGDAYFELVDGRKIYSFIFYILDMDYKSASSLKEDLYEERKTTAREDSRKNERRENIAPPLEDTDDFLTQLQKALLPFTDNNHEDDFQEDLDDGDDHYENNIYIEDDGET